MSAIIKACAVLVRCWNGAAYTEIEGTADDTRELALSAKNQYDQLRASLATVTAERDAAHRELRYYATDPMGPDLLDTERAAHAETRKALEEEQELAEHRRADAAAWQRDLESTRADLGRSEARVKHLEEMASQLSGMVRDV